MAEKLLEGWSDANQLTAHCKMQAAKDFIYSKLE